MLAATTLVLIAVLLAYAGNRWSLKTISLATFAALGLIAVLLPLPDGRFVPLSTVFGGFASEALVAVVALMVLAHVLTLTGALRPLGWAASAGFARAPRLAFALVLAFAFGASGFVNDTPVVVTLLPIMVAAAARGTVNLRRTLMPMNFAVLLGGMMTTLGTSTNLLVVGISQASGGPVFGVLDYYLTALPAALAGLAYLLFVAPRLLGDGSQAARGAPGGGGGANGAANGERSESGARSERDLRFLHALHVRPDSRLAGLMMFEAFRLLGSAVRVRRVMRRGRAVTRLPSARLQAGDVLLVSGDAAELAALRDRFTPPGSAPPGELPADGAAVPAEGASAKAGAAQSPTLSGQYIVPRGSPLAGYTLAQSGLEARLGVRVVGLEDAHHEAIERGSAELAAVPLAVGDVLLVEGDAAAFERLEARTVLLPLVRPERRADRRQAALAALVFAAVIGAAVFLRAPVVVAAVAGVLACVALGLVEWHEIERSANWTVILVIASSIALGNLLVASGALHHAAQALAGGLEGQPPWLTEATILGTAGLLTNFVSNNAAAAILTPMALQLAQATSSAPADAVLAVIFGANLSFLTPMAYQTNLLVMAAAGYRFADFVKVGLPLFLLELVLLSAALALR